MLVKTMLNAKSRGPGIETIAPDAPIYQAARRLSELHIGALVVVDSKGALQGILSERDIVRGVSARGELCLVARVSDLMSETVHTCTENDTVESVMAVMTERRVRHLPVLGPKGALVGIVTIGDVVKSRLDEARSEVDSLRLYVAAG
ncbi:MAG: CBS domain-containing protein [Magnetospirillum sp.]|nr:MAG: CBS domain-containing protein [Magnetospirillum sp.]